MVSKTVIVVVLLLDIVAFGLAVNAERKRNTVRVIADRGLDRKYCRYTEPNVATGYGFGACFCLFASQIIIMVASRCLCCGKAMKPGLSRACAIILFIFCRVTFIIAELCLLAASVKNSHRTKYRSFFGGQAPSCEFLRKGVFAAGAAFTFFTTIFSQFYYISYSKGVNPSESYKGVSASEHEESEGARTISQDIEIVSN